MFPTLTFSASGDLMTLRKRRGVSLEQISELTKIKVSWLKAIEEGRWNELPEGIYRKSYIRQYARATGVDEQDLLNAFPPCAFAES